ncbi:MAG: NAD(P)H-hydrate dehydratase [Candidatus Acidiferrales bacterium]
MKILTAAEMREVDRLTTERYGIPSLTLMENAGKSVVEFIQQRFPNILRRRIVVLCGKGNNGGDGLVVARHLLDAGAKPAVYLLAAPDELRRDGATTLQRWQNSSGELHVVHDSSQWTASKIAFGSSDVIVDALLGTGVRGPVEGLLQQVINDVNRRPAGSSVVAVDIPSGISADAGASLGDAIRADYTVAFTAPKPGLISAAGSAFAGRLCVMHIGSPRELVEKVGQGNVRWLEAREFEDFALARQPASNKGDYGHALIVAGSVGKSGAAVLASWAALRAGAGLVTVATPAPVQPLIAPHTPEIMSVPLAATDAGTVSARCLKDHQFDDLFERKNALAIGPGLSTHAETQEFVRTVVGMRSRIRIILDADGLNAFAGRTAELKDPKSAIAMTPHPGEMARLLGSSVDEVQAHRFETARKAAADWNAHVILKGHQTVIAAPDGRVWINSTGNPGMATGGTGDVLAGMLAGLTAQFVEYDWPSVLCFGVYLHGLAGDIAAAEVGEVPLTASDLIRAIPRAYQQFYGECGRA